MLAYAHQPLPPSFGDASESQWLTMSWAFDE